jgi:hypothetical protein
MSMPGFPSIEKNRVRWSSSVAGGYLAITAVGILAGVAVACTRMPIHLPGHKAILWMVPVLAARIMTRARAGALIGTMAAAVSALCLGGRLAGGLAFLPLLILAGAALDAGAECAQRRPFAAWQRLLILAAAGLVANIFCFAKRLFDPIGSPLSAANMKQLAQFAASHAVFGLLAGLLGAAAGYSLLSTADRADRMKLR